MLRVKWQVSGVLGAEGDVLRLRSLLLPCGEAPPGLVKEGRTCAVLEVPPPGSQGAACSFPPGTWSRHWKLAALGVFPPWDLRKLQSKGSFPPPTPFLLPSLLPSLRSFLPLPHVFILFLFLSSFLPLTFLHNLILPLVSFFLSLFPSFPFFYIINIYYF